MSGDDETLLLLSAYADGELSPGEVLAMERRLAAEPGLRDTAERLRGLSGALRETLAQVPVPENLRGHVIGRIGFADPATRRGWLGSWQALAATLLLGLAGGAAIGGGAVYQDRPEDAMLRTAVLAGHLRGLAAPQPFDIASADGHVVKPWFNGRTTIAPDAPDLAEQGFPLVGGRVDIVAGSPVPTLVYRRDRHVISVTVVPASGDAPTDEERRDGSTIERWTQGDLTYWAVSDLNTRDMRRFADLFRSRTGRPG
ncbi:Transmembrane transcriptional regulator (anti-sigma factor RsiW) [Methylobacterium phyllostachyos]|uniref:Transmembrane transcriptional regulator (Anti-sigma factor RsiW) n=1 Tax=Methylobacterium phyllostachyos TaxID=582672 RepID=A0A1H0DFC6_9HYPH|nr:anti-sigma factor [Methylobacterium phyllostachyos]SDN68788.1 Transmembrane transcriptional regulator (anti-sigma factor RsiW) [Methylobacterium phyllostachyos]